MNAYSLIEITKNNDILLGHTDLGSLTGSCALVGNSGILMDRKDGKLIDSHDFIIRCNEAHVEGFEENVGSRTDIRIANSHMFHSVLENTTLDVEEMADLFSEFDRYFLYRLRNEIIVAKNSVDPNSFSEVINKLQKEYKNKVSFFNPAVYNYCMQVLGNHPTTGFVGLLLALKYFEKISCFGFTFFEEKDWTKKHYYEEITPYDMSSHTFQREKQIFREMSSLGKLQMYPDIFKED
tara:strand:- start:19 stop:729 length:711 start_codon:yes stop_codon:yes gene_type:complete